MDTPPDRHALTSEESAALLRARIITGALMSGIATFMVVASFLVTRGSIGNTLPAAAHNFLHVALIGAFGVVLASPYVGRAAARNARTGIEAFFLDLVVKEAMREGVGLAGIVFAMLAGHLEWIVAFGALSLVAMAWGWPRAEGLRNASRERRA